MSRRIHMGGICGMGMAPLAAFLKAEGNDVSGFDDKPDKIVANWLDSEGIRLGKSTDFISDRFDEFIISSALKRRLASLSKTVFANKVMLRGEKWAEICASRRLLAVTGSHGKSSVSALLAHAILKLGKLHSGFLVGAIPQGFAPTKFAKDGDILVSEIDESDGTIENFSPEICVALNGDLDHVDTYPDNEALEAMFTRLFARTGKCAIYPEYDAILSHAAKKSGVKSRAVKIRTGADFNEINREMARAALEEAFGEKFNLDIFEDYRGLLRRQETIAKNANFEAIADYAHHPHEVESFLKWLTVKFPDAKKTVIFQPHRYSRTKRFAPLFARIIYNFEKIEKSRGNICDVRLMKVYAASEPFDHKGESDTIIQELHALDSNVQETPEILISQNGAENLAIESARNSSNEDSHTSVFAIIGAGDAYFGIKKILLEKGISAGKIFSIKI